MLFDGPYELHRDPSANVSPLFVQTSLSCIEQVIYIAEARSRIRKLIFTQDGGVRSVRVVAGNGRRGHRDHPSDGRKAMFGYPLRSQSVSITH